MIMHRDHVEHMTAQGEGQAAGMKGMMGMIRRVPMSWTESLTVSEFSLYILSLIYFG